MKKDKIVRPVSITIKLSVTEEQWLRQIAQSEGRPAPETLRELIRDRAKQLNIFSKGAVHALN